MSKSALEHEWECLDGIIKDKLEELDVLRLELEALEEVYNSAELELDNLLEEIAAVEYELEELENAEYDDEEYENE